LVANDDWMAVSVCQLIKVEIGMLGWKFNCDSVIVEQVYFCLQDGLYYCLVGLHRLANLIKFEVKDDMPVLLHNG
jgi:hypothetical protein